MRIRVGDLVKKKIPDTVYGEEFKHVFAVCLVISNQVLVNNNTVGVEVEYLFLEGDPQEIDRLLSIKAFESEEALVDYYNTMPWVRKRSRSCIMKVIS